jgi:phosphoglycolate phosphatase
VTPPTPAQAVIFDLDGTLVQTRAASWEVFRPISEQFGLGITRPEQYFDLFRGNIYASIRSLCRDEAQSEQVKQAFLDRLREEYNPALVPGMADVVRRLAGHCTLAVMSSNTMSVLRRILTANDLAFCFAHVFSGDVTPDKRSAIRQFMADAGSGFGRRCEADYDESGNSSRPNRSRTVLVTDTAGDVRDALAEGIQVVGVAWGMHSVEELTAAGAAFVAYWPQELAARLLGDGAAEPPTGACALPAADGSTDACESCAGSGACRHDPPASAPTEEAAASVAGASVAGVPVAGALVAAGARRRERRRDAAARVAATAGPRGSAPVGPATQRDLLAAMRRICTARESGPLGTSKRPRSVRP